VWESRKKYLLDLLVTIVVATLQEVRIIVDRINSLPLHHAFYKSMYLEFIAVLYYRPVTSRGHQEGRRVFREGPKYFELCPIVLNYVRHIFPGGAKFFSRRGAPLVTVLLHYNKHDDIIHACVSKACVSSK